MKKSIPTKTFLTVFGVLFLFSVITSCSRTCKKTSPPEVTAAPTVTKEALFGMHGAPGSTILDVRTQEAWEDCDTKIPGAVHENPSNVRAWSGSYSKDRPLILYCSCDNSKTSNRVAAQLMDMGFTNVKVLKGGWKEWIESDYPTEPK